MKATKTMILVRIMKDVKVCGINTEQRMMMAFVKLASNKKIKN